MIRYIIVDFDGTFADTRKANKLAYREAFSECGQLFSDELYDKVFGLRFDDMCNALGVTQNLTIRNKIRAKKAEVYHKYASEITINKTLYEFIKQMKSQGMKICLASTARLENIQTVLKSKMISEGIFDYMLTGESVSKGKPSPEIYIKAMVMIGNPSPKDVLVFEDSNTGISSAQAAGITNIIKVRL